MTKKIILGLILLGLTGIANAAIIQFDLSYDGTLVSVDAGSTTPAGSSLVAGDSFELDFHTTGNDFWRVDSNYGPQFVPLDFSVSTSGTRVANVQSLFLLNGVQVANITELGVSQSFAHIGAQSWSLLAGLEFDQILMDYDLLSSTAATVIGSAPNIFNGFGLSGSPFFDSNKISYQASVPEPSIIALFGLGLLGLGFARRRKA